MNTRKKRYGNGNTPFVHPAGATRSYTRRRTREVVTYDCSGTHMTNDDVKVALGCDPKRHWPDAGVEPKLVNGIPVKVLPKAATKGQGRRCVALHETCGKWVCTGHFGQHLAACDARGRAVELEPIDETVRDPLYAAYVGGEEASYHDPEVGNPYAFGTPEYAEWVRGWNVGLEEQR